MRLFSGLFAAVGLWALLGADTHAQKPLPHLDSALQRTSTGPVRVIVRTQPGSTADVAGRLKTRGRGVITKHQIIDAFTAEILAEDLALVASDPMIVGLSLDARVLGHAVADLSPTAAVSSLQATLGLPIDGVTGLRTGVAIVDSGIDPNGDLTGLKAFDFTGEGPFDDYGHGTHIAGLIGGSGALSQGAYAGVAPGARLISLKVLDARGFGLTSTVIEAIEFAVRNRRALGIDVINLSLGHPILERAATDPLVQAVEAAARAGVTVVVSAGNVGRNPITGEPGYAGILSPANAPSAISVGALDTRNTVSRADDAVAAFSSRGPTWYDALPKPDLVAPGRDLTSNAVVGSLLFNQLPERQVAGNGGRNRYLRLSGTSMAAAVTTGTVALMIEAARAAGMGLSPAMIKAILEYTALPVAGADRLTQGHGGLNAAGAITLATAVVREQLSSSEANRVFPLTTIGGDTWAWAQTFDWDETVVWGNHDWDETVVWGNDWDETVVWGNHDWDETVVWGNHDWDETVVWGNHDWDETVVWGNIDWDETVVWGNVDRDETVVWGNHDWDETVVWGNIDWDETVVWGNTLLDVNAANAR